MQKEGAGASEWIGGNPIALRLKHLIIDWKFSLASSSKTVITSTSLLETHGSADTTNELNKYFPYILKEVFYYFLKPSVSQDPESNRKMISWL